MSKMFFLVSILCSVCVANAMNVSVVPAAVSPQSPKQVLKDSLDRAKKQTKMFRHTACGWFVWGSTLFASKAGVLAACSAWAMTKMKELGATRQLFHIKDYMRADVIFAGVGCFSISLVPTLILMIPEFFAGYGFEDIDSTFMARPWAVKLSAYGSIKRALALIKDYLERMPCVPDNVV